MFKHLAVLIFMVSIFSPFRYALADSNEAGVDQQDVSATQTKERDANLPRIVVTPPGEVDYSLSPEAMTIKGLVKFELHYTRVIEQIPQVCLSIPCLRSEPYWSVVIKSGDSRFELHQKFHLGNSKAPRVIEVAGIPLQDGSTVEVMGDVLRSADPHYFILLNVQAMKLL